MPTQTLAAELVALRECCCRLKRCQKLFYLCQSCDRGQCYCSKECRAYARKLRHRAASARYQSTAEGRKQHRDCQRSYRERQRARTAILVTDPSCMSSDSSSSSNSDASRPVQLPIPTVRQRRFQHIPWSGLRCSLCRCPGYVERGVP
jgi:hypothetical protein